MSGGGAGKRGGWLIRALGSAVALGLILWFLPLERIGSALGRLSAPIFLSVLVAFLACHVVTATKWWVLMGRAIPWRVALRAHFAGLAANLCLPGAVGGDAVRAGFAHAYMRDGPRVAVAAIVDRLIDMVALACLALSGLVLVPAGNAPVGLALGVGGVVAALALATLVILPWLIPAIWRRWPHLPMGGLFLRVADGFSALRSARARIAVAFLLSLLAQAMLVTLFIGLAMSVGVALPWPVWFLTWPLAKIVATLPISLGGLGVREGTLAALALPFGASAHDVVAAGLAWQAVLWLAGGIGALTFPLGGPMSARIKQEAGEGAE
ncbi:uncharacterized membrane protein YbhN (UPF0104 family) [Albidovulum inexpectatum]|uniref:Uncharacterized membrane protein YbhN (UPF0104 family) n=1 Tax=Albidovulum inexpectatum TaxID=196587 RepID=A0A2S5JDK6_9RHOB|nr:lysylphosphatidylglycerol synthase transmembrane domain-containing protein [Albidovulum inexpectatum]PPB79511.1 uncharacterized membrane protein YbhN (UPF0104 family) [Albidovulum inexpectatum]